VKRTWFRPGGAVCCCGGGSWSFLRGSGVEVVVECIMVLEAISGDLVVSYKQTSHRCLYYTCKNHEEFYDALDMKVV
jgi:hypothetical protein